MVYNISSLKKQIGNATVCVEQYKTQISDGNIGYDLCLYSYYFNIDEVSKETSTINVVYFKRTYERGNQWQNPSEWKMYTGTVIVDGVTKITFDNTIQNELSSTGIEWAKGTLLEHLKDLIAYAQGKESRNITKKLVALNVVGDAGMFMLANYLGNLDSEKENKIKDANKRRLNNDPKRLANFLKNKEEEDKKKADPNYTYTKLEPSSLNTSDTVKTILESMTSTLPKGGLTIQNVELDGAFRISYTQP